MANERRETTTGVEAVTRSAAGERPLGQPMATRRHARVPIECALCGAGGFCSVIEVTSGAVCVLHWICPPPGWYLLREARPERGAPLLHGRCPDCMEQLFALRR
jgi:hypothetical protein